jgi:hypothetical protein
MHGHMNVKMVESLSVPRVSMIHTASCKLYVKFVVRVLLVYTHFVLLDIMSVYIPLNSEKLAIVC